MDKAGLLADLANTEGVEILGTKSINIVGRITHYQADCLVSGADCHGKPIAVKESVPFDVLDEGEAGESAYYQGRAFKNRVDSGLAPGCCALYGTVFSDSDLRKRVLGVICTGIASDPTGNVAKAFGSGWHAGVLDLFMAHVSAEVGSVNCISCPTDKELEDLVLSDRWGSVSEVLA